VAITADGPSPPPPDAGDVPAAFAPGDGETRGAPGFEVHLDVFEGPFDLLLGLISKHKLDIPEVALSQVTNEFIRSVTSSSWPRPCWT